MISTFAPNNPNKGNSNMSEKPALDISVGSGSFCSILFFIFLILKLTGYITWPWWIVTAPLWLPLVIVLTIIICAVIFLFGYAYYEKWIEDRVKKLNEKK